MSTSRSASVSPLVRGRLMATLAVSGSWLRYSAATVNVWLFGSKVTHTSSGRSSVDCAAHFTAASASTTRLWAAFKRTSMGISDAPFVGLRTLCSSSNASFSSVARRALGRGRLVRGEVRARHGEQAVHVLRLDVVERVGVLLARRQQLRLRVLVELDRGRLVVGQRVRRAQREARAHEGRVRALREERRAARGVAMVLGRVGVRGHGRRPRVCNDVRDVALCNRICTLHRAVRNAKTGSRQVGV